MSIHPEIIEPSVHRIFAPGSGRTLAVLSTSSTAVENLAELVGGTYLGIDDNFSFDDIDGISPNEDETLIEKYGSTTHLTP